MTLVVESVEKRFSRFPALKGVSFTAPQGAFVALLGPSGSGKTTLLRILGGLEFADVGQVTFDGSDWLSVPARERRAGFVFQQYALFRHMNVAKNIAFGLNVRPQTDASFAGGNRAARQGPAAARPARWSWTSLSERAIGGTAPARRARTCARHRAAYAAVGRTVRRARCESAQGTSRVAALAARPHRRHDHLRDPRSG